MREMLQNTEMNNKQYNSCRNRIAIFAITTQNSINLSGTIKQQFMKLDSGLIKNSSSCENCDEEAIIKTNLTKHLLRETNTN